MEHLFEKLEANAEGDTYPYHMPGHKRRSWGDLPEELYKIDITEIDDFDNLHQPEGILLKLQKKTARIYGAEKSFYLINGSTCGVLSAVSSALPVGGHILMCRNCHKSAYHAVYLRNLKVTYLFPPYLERYDIFDAPTPRQIRGALEREPDIGAVLIVSPTYEGRIADVRTIAEVVHEKGIPLIVDEAHGAHLGLAAGFPSNSCQVGADLVIHSVHKTLPSLTQTALLHVNGELVDRNLLRRFLQIYQSSSPSYLLMASIDNALRYVEQDGAEAFGRFRRLYGDMRKELAECRHLKFVPEDHVRQDVGKLLISVKDTELTGRELYDILLKKYHLQMEMASESFVLAMFTVNDGKEAYLRLQKALLEIDGRLNEGRESETAANKPQIQQIFRECKPVQWKEPCMAMAEAKKDQEYTSDQWMTQEDSGQTLSLREAWDSASEWIPLENSVGRYAGEFINLYPPGIPLLVPGERMTETLCQKLQRILAQGLTVQGVEMRGEGYSARKAYIRVLEV